MTTSPSSPVESAAVAEGRIEESPGVVSGEAPVASKTITLTVSVRALKLAALVVVGLVVLAVVGIIVWRAAAGAAEKSAAEAAEAEDVSFCGMAGRDPFELAPNSGRECVEVVPEIGSFTVMGTLTLGQTQLGDSGTSCRGTGGYDDIAEGVQVKITDASGAVVQLGTLGAGQVKSFRCVFTFWIVEVPVNRQDVYGVEVSHRGIVQFRQDEALLLGLTLG
jgi:hypothetical protein